MADLNLLVSILAALLLVTAFVFFTIQTAHYFSTLSKIAPNQTRSLKEDAKLLELKKIQKPKDQAQIDGDSTQEQTPAKIKAENSYLIAGLKTETHFQRYFNIYNLAKDPLIAISIILLSANPVAQILFPLSMFAVMGWFSFKHSPVESKKESFNAIATFLMYILILLTYLAIHFLDPSFDPVKFNF